jgi:hypothetical protein
VEPSRNGVAAAAAAVAPPPEALVRALVELVLAGTPINVAVDVGGCRGTIIVTPPDSASTATAEPVAASDSPLAAAQDQGPAFQPSAAQERILEALAGRSMRLKDLTREARVSNSTACGQGTGRHGLAELEEAGLVARQNGEWFRPDSPPVVATAEPAPDQGRRRKGTPDDVRRQVLEVLSEEGPLDVEEIVDHLPGRISVTRLAELLDEHEWFERQADGFHLSASGFAELEGQRRG